MQTTWLIQSNLISDAQQRDVCFAAQEVGANVIEATILPFVEDIEIHGEITTDKVIPYGSTKLTRLAQTRGWLGAFMNDNFDVRQWAQCRDDMLNDPLIATFGLASRFDISELPNTSLQDEVFIRPCADLKAFNGTVMKWFDIINWSESIEFGNFQLNSDTPIAISPLQNIQAEWRYFIVDGQIVCGSMYKCNGMLTAEPAGDSEIEEAQKFADKWLPDPVCVMDLALVNDKLYVLEFNSFNSSGFYGHDVRAIVSSVTKYVESL